MPYCKKEGNQEKRESKLKIKKRTCTWKATKQECIVMRQLWNSSWEIWILRCDHCRDRWCASELAEVVQEMQPLTAGFLCSVTVRQCHGISNLQTHSLNPVLCCAAEKGSLDRTSTAHPLGPVGKPVFSSWKLKVMERFTLASQGMVPPMLAISHDFHKQVSSYFSTHFFVCHWLFDLTLWSQSNIYRADLVEEESDSEYLLRLLS